ncbi:hypothetical protein SNE40_014116 [Patella caerulea]|uniref:Uncharacterized protein n=1 Tax=Patella caerulea TaxID=87958 RepID=A0AAN8PQ27_PATCE
MDLNCYLLVILSSCHAVIHNNIEPNKELMKDTLNTLETMKKTAVELATSTAISSKDNIGLYDKRRDVDLNNFNMGIGKRLWKLKEIVKKMDTHRSGRNILGILKDSVHSNLSDLLKHALDEDPPTNYNFSASIWKYPQDSTIWRNRKNKYNRAHDSKPEVSGTGENLDPIMQWMGIGR